MCYRIPILNLIWSPISSWAIIYKYVGHQIKEARGNGPHVHESTARISFHDSRGILVHCTSFFWHFQSHSHVEGAFAAEMTKLTKPCMQVSGRRRHSHPPNKLSLVFTLHQPQAALPMTDERFISSVRQWQSETSTSETFSSISIFGTW